MKRDVFIGLSPEDPLPKDGTCVGKWHKVMYGTRCSHIWHDTVESHWRELGFAVSVLQHAVSDHEERDTRVMVVGVAAHVLGLCLRVEARVHGPRTAHGKVGDVLGKVHPVESSRTFGGRRQ